MCRPRRELVPTRMDLFEGTNNVIHVVATAEKHRLSKPDGLLATNQVAVGATDLTIIESVAHVVQIRTEGFVLKQGLMVQRVPVTGRARNSLGMERGDHGCARNTKRLAVEPQDLREVPLASVLGRITESLEMPIFYDSAKMASESGFPQDIKITLQYRGNPRTFLDRLLEPYASPMSLMNRESRLRQRLGRPLNRRLSFTTFRFCFLIHKISNHLSGLLNLSSILQSQVATPISHLCCWSIAGSLLRPTNGWMWRSTRF